MLVLLVLLDLLVQLDLVFLVLLVLLDLLDLLVLPLLLVLLFLLAFPCPLEPAGHAGPPGLAEPSFGFLHQRLTSCCFVFYCWCCSLAAGNFM